MPGHDPPKDPRDNKRWLLGFGLAILLLANLALVGTLAVAAWRDFSLPPLGAISPTATPDVKTWFEVYRDRVDSLSKLVTALIGLSALYSTVIGLTAYLSAQLYVERFKEALTEARTRSKEQLAEFQERFPSFDDMNSSVRRIIGLLAELVPDVERLDDNEARLTPQLTERIQHYERSVAFFEFLKDDGGPDSQEVFRRLGRFYRALYQLEKKRLAGRKTPLAQKRKPPADCTSEEIAAYRLFDRAEFYIDHVLRKDRDNFAALNEKAMLVQEIDGSDTSPRAKEYFLRSIEKNGKQQRALYWLGYIQMSGSDEDLAEAEKTFTRALATNIWEREKSSRERRADLHYNRACVRSKLGEAAAQTAGAADTWANNAVGDLWACLDAPGAGLLETVLDDIKPGHDLGWLNTVKAGEIADIRKRLGDTTVP